MDKMHYINGEDTTCRLCTRVQETHDHLFFMCRYSLQVWKYIQAKAHTRWPNLSWNSLVEWTSRRCQDTKSTNNKIGALIFAAAVYYIWQERNKRIFQQLSQPATTVGEAIFQVIREQLMSSNGISLADGTRAIWNIPWLARPLRDTGQDR
ncbi:hypothetical protein OIU85_011247 [Salix viminalis]|uniref:Reverse transcriptase zinc-binding domain-containing protein n=1 Tax=Salix viminalis TaxID=40686 RepID=A0A9Q0SFM1_SALVM|nr:hypothetical protein OIU85_011247 [Salix viminalis]